jgi:hypothetical protein
MLARMWGNRNPYTLLVVMQINIAVMESSVEIPQKPKDRNIRSVFTSDITPGHIPQNVLYMQFYTAIRNNDMWFEGKCIQLKDIT